MGGGVWTANSFVNYSTTKGYTISASGIMESNDSAQEMFKSRRLDKALDPRNVVRECCDSEEHPETVPVIIGLDTTGSMSGAGVEVAKKLNIIMTDLYDKYKDIQIMIMGIGDLAYDNAPIQMSQFESDIRIAEQLDKIYFERGGGGNGFESYSAAWYCGLHHTKLDCWEKGKRGIIITTGDEPLNPHLPVRELNNVMGDHNENDIETKNLYPIASEKFDIFHIAVEDKETMYSYYKNSIEKSFGKYLDSNHLKVSTLDGLAKAIVECIEYSLSENTKMSDEDRYISW